MRSTDLCRLSRLVSTVMKKKTLHWYYLADSRTKFQLFLWFCSFVTCPSQWSSVRGVRGIFLGGGKVIFSLFFFPVENSQFGRPKTNFNGLEKQKKKKQTNKQTNKTIKVLCSFSCFFTLPFWIFHLPFYNFLSFLSIFLLFPVGHQKFPGEKCLGGTLHTHNHPPCLLCHCLQWSNKVWSFGLKFWKWIKAARFLHKCINSAHSKEIWGLRPLTKQNVANKSLFKWIKFHVQNNLCKQNGHKWAGPIISWISVHAWRICLFLRLVDALMKSECYMAYPSHALFVDSNRCLHSMNNNYSSRIVFASRHR